MLKSVLLLAIGLLLALGAGGVILYRTLDLGPAVAATQAPTEADAEEVDLDNPPAEAEPASGAPSAPVVRRGSEGLGGSEGFTCVVETGVRRCRTSD